MAQGITYRISCTKILTREKNGLVLMTLGDAAARGMICKRYFKRHPETYLLGTPIQ